MKSYSDLCIVNNPPDYVVSPYGRGYTSTSVRIVLLNVVTNIHVTCSVMMLFIWDACHARAVLTPAGGAVWTLHVYPQPDTSRLIGQPFCTGSSFVVSSSQAAHRDQYETLHGGCATLSPGRVCTIKETDCLH